MITVLFDGIAYGMLLFILACGLSVTLGLMNFINLAHGAFAMLGGYATIELSTRYGVPFLATIPIAFVMCAVLGAVLERTLYARLYDRGHLDQVLFSIGLVFMAVAAATYLKGSPPQYPVVPEFLKGRTEVLGIGMGRYQLFLILVCGMLTLLLQWLLSSTRVGSQLRAAVDDRRVASGLGIDVGTLFLATFAIGSGLAGLGGALSAELLGMDPTFPLKYMIFFLLVVTVGGTSTIVGPLAASLILGITDVVGNYALTNLKIFGHELPPLGGFIIYTVMIAVLLIRPQGLFARTR